MLYEKIKTMCKEKNIPIRKLELNLGFSQGSVCKWNDVCPSVDKVKKVADFLGVTVDELISDKAS